MTPDRLAAWLSVLDPLLRYVVGALVSYTLALIAHRVRDKHRAELLQTLTKYAADAVGYVYQTVVKELKDPTARGTWDARAKEVAKQAAVDRVKRLAPGVLEALARAGEDTEGTVDTLVERAVVDLAKDLGAPPAQGANGILR